MSKKQKLLFVFAHPDDEAIGTSKLIYDNRTRSNIAFMTDGMPHPSGDSKYYPPYTKLPPYGDLYAEVRKLEAECAASELGVPVDRIEFINIPDMELINNMLTAFRDLRSLILRVQPELIITHAYEGGHIDHDLTSFIVSYLSKDNPQITLIEAYLYNFEAEDFNHNLPLFDQRIFAQEIILNNTDKMRKKFAFAQYASQSVDLNYFNPEANEWIKMIDKNCLERFKEPPHQGTLQYERSGNFRFADFKKAIQKFI